MTIVCGRRTARDRRLPGAASLRLGSSVRQTMAASCHPAARAASAARDSTVPVAAYLTVRPCRRSFLSLLDTRNPASANPLSQGGRASGSLTASSSRRTLRSCRDCTAASFQHGINAPGHRAGGAVAVLGGLRAERSAPMGTTLERRVAELEARAQRLTRLLEQVTGMLEHLTGAADPSTPSGRRPIAHGRHSSTPARTSRSPAGRAGTPRSTVPRSTSGAIALRSSRRSDWR